MREKLAIVSAANGKAWHHRARSYGMRWPHCHDELEANLVVEGRAAYVIDGRRVEIAPDDLLFLHPDQEHLLVDESVDFRMWLAVWRTQSVIALCRRGLDAGARMSAPTTVQVRRLQADPARRMARLFADVTAQDGQMADAGVTYLLWRTRAEFLNVSTATGVLANPVCARAARLLREDPAQAVLSVAAQIGVTADHLERIFRRETGLGLVVYRTRVRLARALELWDDGCRSLTHLALDCGFNSYSAFQRAFIARYGRTPKEYLGACRE